MVRIITPTVLFRICLLSSFSFLFLLAETSYDSITKMIEIRLKDLRVALESVADKLMRTEKK